MINFKSFLKANRFLKDSFKQYIIFSTKSERIFDLLFPFVLSFCFVVVVYFFNNLYVENFIKKIDSLNSTVITAVSILAGFNFAGVSVISSSQSDLVQYLKTKLSKIDRKTSMFTILMVFFTWSIAIQLVVVCFGIILFFSNQFFIPDSSLKAYVPLWAWCVIAIWLGVVLHSLFLSIRNIKMLFLFVTKDYKKAPDEFDPLED